MTRLYRFRKLYRKLKVFLNTTRNVIKSAEIIQLFVLLVMQKICMAMRCTVKKLCLQIKRLTNGSSFSFSLSLSLSLASNAMKWLVSAVLSNTLQHERQQNAAPKHHIIFKSQQVLHLSVAFTNNQSHQIPHIEN